MKLMYRSAILLGVWLALLMAGAGSAPAQSTRSFTGKITGIARGTELDLGKRDTFYIVRLGSYPKTEFRLPHADAVRYGVIVAAAPTAVVTPKQSKGLGWRVKLICENKNIGERTAPVYKVISLERLDD
jgi:hypothetical protein